MFKKVLATILGVVLLATPAFAEYRPDDVSTAPDHWWKLDEASGTRADSIGAATLADNATVLSDTGVTESLAAYIDRGNSEFLSTGDSSVWDLAGDFTISTWVYYSSSFPGDSSVIGVVGHSNGGGGWYFGYVHYAADASKLFRFTTYTGGYTHLEFNNATVLGTITIDTWHHITLRRDSDDWYFYLDGVEVESINNSVTVNNNALDLSVGYSGGLAATVGTFRMQDTAIWDGYAITTDEVGFLAENSGGEEAARRVITCM